MNVPNMLTISRLGLAALMLGLLSMPVIPFAFTVALLIFIVAGLTDYLDGHLARNVYGITSFGKLMDPLADKVIVCAAFVSFVELDLVPAYLVVIIIAREFLVTGLRLLAVGGGQVISAGRWGKHKTIWQIVAIIAILAGLALRHDILRGEGPFFDHYDHFFPMFAYGLTAAVAAITVVSGYRYFSEHRDVLGGHLDAAAPKI